MYTVRSRTQDKWLTEVPIQHTRSDTGRQAPSKYLLQSHPSWHTQPPPRTSPAPEFPFPSPSFWFLYNLSHLGYSLSDLGLQVPKYSLCSFSLLFLSHWPQPWPSSVQLWVPHIYNRPLQYTPKSIMSSFFFIHIHMTWSSHSTGNIEWQITWIMRRYGSSSIIHNR